MEPSSSSGVVRLTSDGSDEAASFDLGRQMGSSRLPLNPDPDPIQKKTSLKELFPAAEQKRFCYRQRSSWIWCSAALKKTAEISLHRKNKSEPDGLIEKSRLQINYVDQNLRGHALCLSELQSLCLFRYKRFLKFFTYQFSMY